MIRSFRRIPAGRSALALAFVLVLAFALALASGCASTASVADAPRLDGTVWVLSALPGQPLIPGHSATLRFEGGRVSGSDGCNRFNAPYEEKGSALQIGPHAASTRMACPPEIMAQADALLGAFEKARSYRVEAGQLSLLAADGRALATFAPQPSTVAGTAWRVTGYNNGKQAVVSVAAETIVTMAFSSDGRVSGSAGCNNYMATYTADGDRLTIGPAAATKKLCGQPAEVMEQEQLVLKALELVATARLEGDRLELRSAAGALVFSLARE
jgi:heat shock protein HslJ